MVKISIAANGINEELKEKKVKFKGRLSIMASGLSHTSRFREIFTFSFTSRNLRSSFLNKKKLRKGFYTDAFSLQVILLSYSNNNVSSIQFPLIRLKCKK